MTDRSSAFTLPLVRTLARLGVRHVCITPGSRSTPLALAFAAEPDITDWIHHDERSSGFFALGIARHTHEPVAIVTTSGTAATELHPALAEARHARAGLIALTADRPAHLRDVGAPQTMDQEGLFGRTVAWAHDAEPTGDDDPAHVVALAARLFAVAVGPPAAPVHLNVRYREPLLPTADPPPAPDPPAMEVARHAPEPETVREVAALAAGRRGVIVVGPQDDPEVPQAAKALAEATGWPVIGDALSGLRRGPHRSSIGASSALAAGGWLDRADPDFVIRVGALPTSKPLWTWLEAHRGIPHVFVEPYGWRDPLAAATAAVRADPAATLGALAGAVSPAPDSEWPRRWRAADDAALAAIDGVLADTPFPNEPAVARLVGRSLPEGATLWVGSSMPVRDVDAFLEPSGTRLSILGNRGVNGIDGLLSAGLGSAAASGEPTTVLAGDLSALHDVGALATAARLGVDATFLVVDNDGGGIFHFLPQAGHPSFERLFGTPHGLDLAAIAEAFGIEGVRIDDADTLAHALARPSGGPRLITVQTDREENVAVHRAIEAAVREAIAGI